MDAKFAKLFDLTAKNKEFTVFAGDDHRMGSVAPYGISSGLAEMDLYLGRKAGFPAAKIIELYGLQMTGKTTFALQHAAEVQKRGGLVIFIDTEKTYTPERARELGCVPENIIKHEADTVEEIFKIIHHYFGEIVENKSATDQKKKKKAGVLDGLDVPVIVIVDSITGVPTIADIKGNIEDFDRPGFEAKQIKRGVRKINPMLSELACKPSIIFINHAIAKIVSFGKKTGSAGGNGLKFYASVRVEFTHAANIQDSNTKERFGQKIKVLIEKLKGGHLQFPTFNLDLTNDSGFDQYESLKLAMIATGMATRPSGSSVVTILKDTEYETQVTQSDFKEWVNERGYDEVYRNWRRWCIREGYLDPWGSE